MNQHEHNSRICIPDYMHYMPRPRLFELIDRHRQVKLMTAVAEPGYGKTALLSSYFMDRNMPAIWYQLHDNGNSAGSFVAHLLAALGKELKLRPHLRVPKFIHADAEGLLHTLSNWPEELHIILDHAHVLQESRDILDLVERLIHETPPGIHFVVIGQTLPSLPYASYKLRRNYFGIGPSELAFTKEELALFFQDLPAAPLTEPEIEFILQSTEGWPASLELLHDALKGKSMEERSRLLPKLPKIPHLYDYIDREMIKPHPPELRSLLLKTSIMKELEPSVLMQYLDTADTELPALFVQRFTFAVDPQERTFRYHKLFRSFLLEQYRQETSRSAINQDHLRLSAIYEENHRFFPAFAHSILGRDFVNAGRLMRILQVRYQPQEFMELLQSWLEEFFDHHYLESSIFLYRCIPLYILHSLIARLENHLVDLDNRHQQLWAARIRQQLAGIYKLIGDLGHARALSEAALHTFEAVQDQPMMMLSLNFLADLLLNLGEPAEAKACAQRSLFLAESVGDLNFLPYALSGMADTLIEDQVPEAVEYLEKALERGQGNDDALRFFLHCSRCKLYTLLNDVPMAVEWARQTVKLAEEFGFDRDIGLANLYLARAYVSAGRLSEAEACLETAHRMLQPFRFLFAHVVSAQYALLLQQHKPEAAGLKWRELHEVCEKNGYPFIIGRYKHEQREKTAVMIEAETAPLLRIQVLGPFGITINQQPVAIRRKTSLRLLLYLIVNHGARIPQDMIIEELFKDQPLGPAQNQLYVALSVLRSTLEPGVNPGRNSRYIKNADGLYALNTGLVELDLADFLEAGREDGPIRDFMRAEQLYKGDLLEEYRYEAYIEAERERLRIKYLHILSTLAEHFAREGDHYRSMEYYEKLCAKDPYNSKNVQAYVNMLRSFHLHAYAQSVAERMNRLSAE
ncbi:BTAD domain-containing putative transcriptional regulator [Paenibacillus sp. NFR01]|uniref:BTAD domain-containing putative transcriptional regulator n=1 Tax=Paenibacillus sp. NFR01 TaxID=1566279 RepID=UPI0008ABA414|nr:BTAD domain-containing putative transcriptional regulator [Paenibacillus sp. NFR01]SET60727.1 LuxR family transcriptional regulator, maltose regulon positive regulatory protein [Paenibacillus sp. NFR01]